MDDLVGKTILHYRIHAVVGEGAMGKVYKAHDLKLDRDVALKCVSVSGETSKDERDAIIREAKAASSISHPNVCTIHDIMEHDGMIFIVMELVEGSTLRERIKDLTIKDVLEIGIQVAEGLAAAHNKGVVHRDIKPENIMLRKDGVVQIMDFGLAKVEGRRDSLSPADSTALVGTISYMSPEQVQGVDVDFRSDIFSLGVVLYELLTSEFPYKGIHEAAIMYEILNSEVEPLTLKKREIDPELDRIVLECLEKDREERYQSARELAKDLRRLKRVKKSQDPGHPRTGQHTGKRISPVTHRGYIPAAAEPASGGSEKVRSGRYSFLKSIRKRAGRWLLALLSAGVAILLTVVVTEMLATGLPGIHASILQPPGITFDNGSGSNLAISPNGKYLVFVCKDSSGNDALYVRPLGSSSATRLVGADDTSFPFWSPDSKFVGYFYGGKLVKVAVDGRPPLDVCDAQNGAGASWNRDGEIIFAGSPRGGIYEVSAGGGKPDLILSPDSAKGQLSFKWPWFLPDGNHFLFSVQYDTAGSPTDGVDVGSLTGSEERLLQNAASNAEYSEGYIFFMGQSVLLAQPFDPGRLALTGESAPVAGNVQYFSIRMSGSYSVSKDGVLVYQEQTRRPQDMVLLDRNGRILDTLFSKPVFRTVVLSPNQKMLAFDCYDSDENNFDVWTYDLARNVATRLSMDRFADTYPLWSPDDKRVVFSSNRGPGGSLNFFIENADGSGGTRPLFKFDNNVIAEDWSPGGKSLLVQAFDYAGKNSGWDILAVPLSGRRGPAVVLGTNYDEEDPRYSPDGKWISYISDESGQKQLYVVSFTGAGSRWQVSVGGAKWGKWVDGGKEIYFVSNDDRVFAVDVRQQGNSLTFSKPEKVFSAGIGNERAVIFDISNSGNKFVTGLEPADPSPATITVMSNWRKVIAEEK